MIGRFLRISVSIVGVAYFVSLAVLGFLIGPFDYDHLSAYYELAWKFWNQSPGLPQFNPFLCGGITLGADPQIPIFHPIILLVPLIGAPWTLKLELLTQVFLGAWGLNEWLKDWKVEENARLWGLLLFLCGGGVVGKSLVGHVTLGCYLLLPLFFLLSYRLSKNFKPHNKRIISLYWLLFIYSGFYKPNFFIYLVPLLLVETLIRSWLTKDILPAKHFIIALFLSTLCNAISEIPAFFYFREFPNRFDTHGAYYTPIYTLLANLILPIKTIPKILYGPGIFLQRHEYNFFLSPIGLFFALKQTSRINKTNGKLLSLAIFILLSFWLGLGSPESGLSPWFSFTWLTKVWPGASSIRVPTRLWFGGFLGLIIFSSLSFSHEFSKIPRWVLLMFGIIPLVGSAIINLSKITTSHTKNEWAFQRLYPSDILQTYGSPTDIYEPIKMGKGVIRCVPNLAVAQSQGLKEDDSLNVISSIPAQSDLKWLSWNRISISSYSLDSNSFILQLNLNSSKYWKFEGVGSITLSEEKPLTLRGHDGKIDGILRFETPWVMESLLLSILGWILFFLLQRFPLLFDT